MAVKILHKLSAVIFVLAGIGHAAQYKDVKKLQAWAESSKKARLSNGGIYLR